MKEINLGVKPAKYDDGEKLSDVMTYNHYGTETIPPRPVLRIAAEKVLASAEFKQKMKAFLKNVAAYTMSGQPGLIEEIEYKLLVYIGQQAIAEAKRIIDGGTELQPNAPRTIAKKGFDKPLYETGLMIKNMEYEVTE